MIKLLDAKLTENEVTVFNTAEQFMALHKREVSFPEDKDWVVLLSHGLYRIEEGSCGIFMSKCFAVGGLVFSRCGEQICEISDLSLKEEILNEQD